MLGEVPSNQVLSKHQQNGSTIGRANGAAGYPEPLSLATRGCILRK